MTLVANDSKSATTRKNDQQDDDEDENNNNNNNKSTSESSSSSSTSSSSPPLSHRFNHKTKNNNNNTNNNNNEAWCGYENENDGDENDNDNDGSEAGAEEKATSTKVPAKAITVWATAAAAALFVEAALSSSSRASLRVSSKCCQQDQRPSLLPSSPRHCKVIIVRHGSWMDHLIFDVFAFRCWYLGVLLVGFFPLASAYGRCFCCRHRAIWFIRLDDKWRTSPVTPTQSIALGERLVSYFHFLFQSQSPSCREIVLLYSSLSSPRHRCHPWPMPDVRCRVMLYLIILAHINRISTRVAVQWYL